MKPFLPHAPRFGGIAACLPILACAVLIKGCLAGADALKLDWLLWPASCLVSCCTGLSFISMDGAGYYNEARGILIAPACAGVNFLVIALASGGCLAMFHSGSLRRRACRLLGVIVTAYAATILANTVRIVLAVFLYQAHGNGVGPFSPEGLHRLEGTVVYYGFLLLFILGLGVLCKESRPVCAPDAAHGKRDGIPRRAAVLLLPLACYLFFTLGLPLLNGAALRFPGLFAEHGLTVLAVSMIFSLAAFFTVKIMRKLKALWRMRANAWKKTMSSHLMKRHQV